jgi:two-component sensor histidine kinase
MKIGIKFTIALVVLTLILVYGTSLYQIYEKKALVSIFLSEARNEQKELDQFIALMDQPILLVSRDYTVWDDFVTFIGTGDADWARTNIDTILSAFQSNALWVYGTDGALVYSANNVQRKGMLLEDIPLPPHALDALFAHNNRFCHFYLNTPAGVMDVRGATIHPSTDQERLTPPAGYFFVCRLWDRKFLNELEDLFGPEIVIDYSSDTRDSGISMPEQGWISFPKLLTGWDHAPLASLRIKVESRALKEFSYGARRIFALMGIIAALFIVSIMVLLIWWVYVPLRAISLALRSNSLAAIGGLRGKKDEFGEIAGLLSKFLKQRESLIREIAVRKKADEKIKASLQEKEVLLREIDHRVKNNLQIINSLYSLQAEKSKDAKVRSILKESQSRVRSISLVHEKLYQSRDIAKIDVEEYVKSLVQDIKSLFAINTEQIVIEISVEKDIDMGIDKVVNCGLIINELVTNAYKYAFSDGRAGVISLGLCKSAKGEYTLTIADNGVGMPEGFNLASVETLGLEMVRLLANQMGSLRIEGKKGTTVKVFIKDEKQSSS